MNDCNRCGVPRLDGALVVAFGVNALLDDFGMSQEFHEKLDDFMSGDGL